MYRYAILDSYNFVKEIVTAEEEQTFNAEVINAVDITNTDVGLDWIYDAITHTFRTPSTTELKPLVQKKKEEIKQAWLNEIEKVGMPIEGYNFNVDFGVEDALIWQESVHFVAPEVTEVEVRAIDNTFHVLPRNVYESIPALQKAYYAQMLQKKWELQKQADNAATLEELEQIKW